MKKILLLFVLAIVTLISCRKDSDVIQPNPTTPTVQLNASFKGLVVDQSGVALENVEVKIGNTTTLTDAQGFFILKNQTVQKDKAFIGVSKDGFFAGSRTVIAQKNATHNVRIMMMTDESIGVVENTTGGEVVLPNGSKVVFPVDGVAHEDGTAYTGMVYVSAKYIDPSTKDGQLSMPGDLRAINDESEVQALTSYGMIAVELKDASGNLLQVANNKSVELQIVIPAEGLATAAATISLWYFDNAKASWIEDGSATKVGNKYVGAVRHFTFWNADVAGDYTTLNINLTDVDGDPVVGILVFLSNPDVPYSPGVGFTNSDGYTGGIIPAGVTLTLTVENNCGAAILLENVGPYSVETTLDFVVNDISIYPNITGTLVGCDGTTPVSNGYVTFHYENWWSNTTYTVDANGDFQFDFSSCIADIETDATLVGYDLDLLNQSDPQTFTLAANVDLGNVTTCSDIVEYFHVTNSAGDQYTALDPYMWILPDSLTGGVTGVIGSIGFGVSNNYFFMHNTDIDAVEVYAFTSNGGGEIPTIGFNSPQASLTVLLNVTTYPASAGEFLIGSGTFIDVNNGSATYNIDFKILRD